MGSAKLQNARLERANLTGARFRNTEGQAASFWRAKMHDTDLRTAQFQKANLSYTLITGTDEVPNVLEFTNLEGSTNAGGALRHADLTDVIVDADTDFRNAFMDASVTLPDAFRAQLGDQCQSPQKDVLTDAEFYGRWRGWIEHPSNPSRPALRWIDLAPPGMDNLTAIPPPEGCMWKTSPLP